MAEERKKTTLGSRPGRAKLASRTRVHGGPANSEVTLDTLLAKMDEMGRQLDELVAHVRHLRVPPSPSIASSPVNATKKATTKKATTKKATTKKATTKKATASTAIDRESFVGDLLAAVRSVDRRGRYGGMVPIPPVRDLFLDRGVSREDFDEQLLAAERDFVIDLKAANDPARLADPELAVRDAGRGHLQFVVLR